MMTFTEKRRSIDMSLGECARACGMKTRELSRIERGTVKPTDEQCSTIGAAVGWSVQEVRDSLPDGLTNERTLDSLLAIAAVSEDAKAKGLKKGHGGTGSIECPICKGRLNYSVASHNGHIWGACQNPTCVSWMQ